VRGTTIAGEIKLAASEPVVDRAGTVDGPGRPGSGGRRGRPPTASPDDVLALVTELYLAGQRVDVTVVAARLGLGRATIYRWFGSREALLGEVVARQLELLVERKRAHVRRRGAAGILEVLDCVNQTLIRSRAVRRLLDQERDGAMRMLTSSAGVVEPRAVACIQALIEQEMAGGYEPPTDPETLAYALVHLRHAFLWNDATGGVRGDYERLRDVQAALLGIPRKGRRRTDADDRLPELGQARRSPDRSS
jgi:AcrR family transcriptional regulator